MNMTMKQAAEAALECQDACNLSGVVFTFADAMKAIYDEAHKQGHGTEWKNEHPIVTLFLHKLADLNGSGDTLGIDGLRKALDAVDQIYLTSPDWVAATKGNCTVCNGLDDLNDDHICLDCARHGRMA